MKQQGLRIIRFALVLAMALTVIYAPALIDWVVGRPSPNLRLHAAIGSRNLAAFQAAVAEGASVHARNEAGTFPLIDAAELGQVEMVQRMIAAGVDLDAVGNHGMTALMCAALQDRIEVIELLICHGAGLSRRDHLNGTALDLANESGSERAAEVLRRAG
jgi:ankyrin repeat protein